MSTALTQTHSTLVTSSSTTPSSHGLSATSAATRAALPRLRLGGGLGPIAEDTTKSPSSKAAPGTPKYSSPSISPAPPYDSRCKGMSAAVAAASTEKAYPAVAFKVDKRFVPTAAPKPYDGEFEPKTAPLALRSTSTLSTEAVETGKDLGSPSLPPAKSYPTGHPLHPK